MFTGLVQGLGLIRPVSQERLHLEVIGESKAEIFKDLAIGDSLAVDGICLTVETIMAASLIVAVSGETLQRTTLGHRQQAASYVNLETSLRLGGKVGGHLVTGHVDGMGCLVASEPEGGSWLLTFSYPEVLLEQWQETIAPYLIPKGSIAVNGISLTIAKCDRHSQWFTVAVIPHTYQATNLAQLQPGNWVNLESDLIGKYVNKLLKHHLTDASDGTSDAINLNFLIDHGYI